MASVAEEGMTRRFTMNAPNTGVVGKYRFPEVWKPATKATKLRRLKTLGDTMTRKKGRKITLPTLEKPMEHPCPDCGATMTFEAPYWRCESCEKEFMSEDLDVDNEEEDEDADTDQT
jgi:predicted RNA-binding Zn-ribbon protein involved in translation (DUF1610 family)